MTLKGQREDHQNCEALISCKATELGPMLLLNINRKSYLGSLVALSHLTFSDLERSVKVTKI